MLGRIRSLQLQNGVNRLSNQGRNTYLMSSAHSAAKRLQQLKAHLSTMAEENAEPVLFEERFAARIYKLNRPEKLNALSHDMVKILQQQITVSTYNRLCTA
jgi:hypothetical protein